ncbi:sodium:solute symporter [Halobacillus halophilus]|uniref:Sodium/solute symporter n=1 Tax=Halobacillus halophilus (strain ATCC 35676 / DSM 2266 / JCM 20832 / KCTC 3685 / LMG 17431 / NBRC 102448 / NCIMB 2269) TaxID=866895 RepID=I0JL86_HALH3|nr:sodium:solute symporter family protein [Halobacillus halophilus]ASF39028.1 sodium:solute symporter [Halobacillus halophilus]CCG44906.1 sodium/solute symporter [Halobacillus halophilus DSM 2266]
MSSYGFWMISLALLYTLALIIVGNVAKRKANRGEQYFVGGRTFRWWTVAFCITGLFSGSTYISIVELSYLTGISAIWYGVAETLQVLLIALLLIKSFREKLIVTISGLIGDQFGRRAKALSGAITAFAFPMWSVATAIAFASAFHVFTGVSLSLSVAFTAILLFVYLQSGGMWAVAFTQTMNTIIFAIMFIIGTVAFFINPGISGLQQLAAEQPSMFDWGGAGLQVILVWFATFMVNVILAQAAFQMALSCKTPEEGRKGLIVAEVMSVPFILLGILFGLSAAAVVPDASLGLVALPQYLMEVLPAPFVGLFFLGIWACALGWGAPCQFSGATSLGKDVGSAIFPGASPEQLVKYTKWSLLLLTGLMIVFGFLRTEQSAWWNVLAWTMRNSATFAPVVAALFWPLVTKRAVIGSLFGGFAAGLIWYHLSNWHPADFFLNIHPVWVGMSVNILVMVLFTVAFNYGNWKITNNRSVKGAVVLAAIALLLVVNGLFYESLHAAGVVGLTLFLNVLAVFIGSIIYIKPKVEEASFQKKVVS